MRRAPRGHMGWRLCPAKPDRQPSLCACALLAAREATIAPHTKGYKKNAPHTDGDVGTVQLRLQDTTRKFTKQDRPNRVDNYSIFELDHNTKMPAYPFLWNLSMLRNSIEIIGEYNGSCLAC